MTKVEALADELEWAKSGLLNVVGGCCGTTPDHIRKIAQTIGSLPPRTSPVLSPTLKLGELEAIEIGREDDVFVNIGERSNVTGSARFRKLIEEGVLMSRSQSHDSKSNEALSSSMSTWTRGCWTQKHACANF